MKGKLPVCIIGGYNTLSKEFFKELIESRKGSIFINLNKKKIKSKNIFNFKIFELKKILNTIRENKISRLIFLGKIIRPNLSDFKSDGIIDKYIPRLLDSYNKGDGQILLSVIEIFNENGMKVISPNNISNNFFFSKDQLKKITKANDLKDTYKSIKILNDLSKYDNAQSIICINGYIIAIEAAESTDDILKRAFFIRKNLNQLNHKAGMLTKIPKKNQSKLVDLPVIGPKTIKLANMVNLNGIAIKHKYTIIENKVETMKLAKKFRIELYNLP